MTRSATPEMDTTRMSRDGSRNLQTWGRASAGPFDSLSARSGQGWPPEGGPHVTADYSPPAAVTTSASGTTRDPCSGTTEPTSSFKRWMFWYRFSTTGLMGGAVAVTPGPPAGAGPP